MSINIVAISGSLKQESVNSKVLNHAVKIARAQGANVTVVDLNDYPMPLLSEDIEQQQGAPESAKALRAIFAQADGILVASPEYNGSISGVLKNAIDWISRPSSGEDQPHAFRNKVVGLLSASPGALGGLRGLVHVKDIFYMLGAVVLPTQAAIGNTSSVIDDRGAVVDEIAQERINVVVDALLTTTEKLATEPSTLRVA